MPADRQSERLFILEREVVMKSLIAPGVLGAFMLAGVFCVSADDVPQVKVTPIFSSITTAIGQPIALPKANAEVHVTMYEIPVGARLPVHKHPFPRYAYVLAGKLRVADKDNVRTFDYAAGDFLIEMIDTWHFGTNIGSEPVRLLVIDQVEAGQPNTIPFK
jgi:quercetin dioxygenase-like cupin family protein